MGSVLNKNTFISTIKGINFCPGQTIVPNSQLEELREDPFFADMVKRGKFVVNETGVDMEFVDKNGNDTSDKTPSEVKAALEIAELTVKQAKVVIAGDPADEDDNGILDITVLKEIAKRDTRKGIQEAVEEQIEMLHSRENEEEEEDKTDE